MHPESLAFAAYHRAYHHPEADHSRMPHWQVLIAWHRDHGIYISTRDAFILARPVDWSREDHADLRSDADLTPGCYHITAAAGELPALLRIAHMHHVTHVSFERISTRKLHRLPITRLRCHLFNRL